MVKNVANENSERKRDTEAECARGVYIVHTRADFYHSCVRCNFVFTIVLIRMRHTCSRWFNIIHMAQCRRRRRRHAIALSPLCECV